MLAKNPDLRPDSWYEVAEFLSKIELRTKIAETKAAFEDSWADLFIVSDVEVVEVLRIENKN